MPVEYAFFIQLQRATAITRSAHSAPFENYSSEIIAFIVLLSICVCPYMLDSPLSTKSTCTYQGWCWPGSVSYLDFLRPEVLRSLLYFNIPPLNNFTHHMVRSAHSGLTAFPTRSQ